MEDESKRRQSLEKVNFSRSGDTNQYKAIYTNPRTKQVFELTAGGRDPEAVAKFTADIWVDLEVVPGDSGRPPETEQAGTSAEEEPETAEETALTFEFAVIDPGSIKPPYSVTFHIDPPISELDQTSGQSYPFPTAQWIDARVNAIEGKMKARLAGSVFPRTARISSPGNAAGSLSGSVNAPAVLTVNVSGSGRFDLTGRYG